MSTFSSDSDFGSATSKAADAEELQQFLAVEQQKHEMRSTIHMLTDMCWDKCIDKPPAKMDSKSEMCLTNCVARFIDVSLLITNRFAQVLQKQAGGM